MDITMFYAISYIASIMSNLITVMSKQNVKLDLGLIMFELSMVVSGFMFSEIVKYPVSANLSTYCSTVIDMTSTEIQTMDKIYSFQLE